MAPTTPGEVSSREPFRCPRVAVAETTTAQTTATTTKRTAKSPLNQSHAPVRHGQTRDHALPTLVPFPGRPGPSRQRPGRPHPDPGHGPQTLKTPAAPASPAKSPAIARDHPSPSLRAPRRSPNSTRDRTHPSRPSTRKVPATKSTTVGGMIVAVTAGISTEATDEGTRGVAVITAIVTTEAASTTRTTTGKAIAAVATVTGTNGTNTAVAAVEVIGTTAAAATDRLSTGIGIAIGDDNTDPRKLANCHFRHSFTNNFFFCYVIVTRGE